MHSLQTVGELISAIKTAARADDLEMMLAFDSEVLQPAMTLEDAKLSEGATVVAIRSPELFLAGTYDDGLTKIWSAETGSCERCGSDSKLISSPFRAHFESFSASEFTSAALFEPHVLSAGPSTVAPPWSLPWPSAPRGSPWCWP